jgi:hypothetical protein
MIGYGNRDNNLESSCVSFISQEYLQHLLLSCYSPATLLLHTEVYLLWMMRGTVNLCRWDLFQGSSSNPSPCCRLVYEPTCSCCLTYGDKEVGQSGKDCDKNTDQIPSYNSRIVRWYKLVYFLCMYSSREYYHVFLETSRIRKENCIGPNVFQVFLQFFSKDTFVSNILNVLCKSRKSCRCSGKISVTFVWFQLKH